MSLAHAFMVLLAFMGACSFAYLIGSFLQFHDHHRRIRRSRWPHHGGHSEHFFRDLKTWPEE